MISKKAILSLQEEYSDVLSRDMRRFITSIWRDTADYKVLVARRMFNLNEALMRIWGYDDEEEYQTDSIMSNTAFLLYARSIADQYAYRKRFPRILICDDIMLHGRGVMKMLGQFRQIVTERLEESGNTVEEWRLEEDLVRAVRIYVYARNEEQILVRDYRLYAEHELKAGELRRLSQKLSGFLSRSGVANTSYVLSAELTRSQMARLLDGSDKPLEKAFIYQGRPQNVYTRLRTPGILETIRLQFPGGDPEDGGILTSLVIFGDIDEKRFERLRLKVADYLQGGARYSQVAGHLRRKSELLTRPQAQMLSFVYSILSLTEFCQDRLYAEGRELYSTVIGGDFDKIITNFDVGDIFRSEMLRLCRDVCVRRSIARPLWEYLEEAVQEVVDDDSIPVSGDFTQLECPKLSRSKSIYDYAEDIFYEVGTDGEYDAFHHIRTGTPYDARQATFDTISLDRYLAAMKRKKISQAESLGSILGMMDSGLLSMNLERQRSMDGDECRTVLKAGELATYILPRRFRLFVPALAAVEDNYRQKGKYQRDVVGGFIDYLQDHGFRQDGKLGQRDKRQLSALKKNKPLLLYIYSAGQTFSEWSTGLTNENPAGSDKFAQNVHFSPEEEKLREDYYVRCAREYLAG